MDRLGKFANGIAQAAKYENHGLADPQAEYWPDDLGSPSGVGKRGRPPHLREAKSELDAGMRGLSADLKSKYGCTLVYPSVRIAWPRTPAEYNFWKAPIGGFIENADLLDLGPTKLVKLYGPSERNFTVTRDTFRAPLSQPSRRDVSRLLKSHGYDLKLPPKFSIRDVQKAMKDKRDRSRGVERFKATVEIIGDTLYCNGKSFKMQPTGSGKRRIRVGNGWLPVERLVALLSGISGGK